MSEKDTDAADLAADETVGHWLRAAREKAGLGRDAVAEALHLDRATIQAIEDNDFERLGAGVFAKGHIKAYASHLSLVEADALERYYRTAGNTANSLPPLLVSHPVSGGGRNRLPQILIAAAALLVLVLIVMAARFLMRDEPDEPLGITPPGGPAVTASETEPAAGSGSDPSEPPARAEQPTGSFADRLANAGSTTPQTTAPPTTAPPTTAPPTTAAAASAREATPAAVPAGGVTLRFSDECWYEVRDANGRRVATGIGQAGQARTVRAERPLAVTLGYAAGAEVFVDGEPFEIPSSARRGRRAIFSVP